MQYMYRVLNTDDIPGGCGVAIEFGVPYTSSRIDFLLTGRQNGARDSAVIVELKQWSELEAVPGKDAIVRTFVGRRPPRSLPPLLPSVVVRPDDRGLQRSGP
jgi:uncharacterized protein